MASNALENNFLDVLVGNIANTSALVLGAVSLSVGDPTDTGTGGAEATGGGFARQASSGATWGAAASGSVTTSAEIAFPESTGAISSGGSISHVRFETSTTVGSGTFLGSAALTTARTVSAAGVTLRFAIGALTLTAD